jgi:hypothetical protein
MKKIYLSLLTLAIFNISKSQTITKAANEPVIGDTENRKNYDSAGVVPKATGAGQNWNFSTFTANTTTSSSVYTSTVGTPNATLFAGATVAENQGAGAYNYWRSVASPTTQFESLGTYDPSLGGISFSYTNPAIYVIWPASFGYSNTDTYGGPVSGPSLNGSLSGTVTSSGSGTGSLTLPGGTQLTNVLQFKVVNNVVVNVTSPSPSTITSSGTDYYYYHSSQKFPLVTVSYQSQTGQPNTAVTKVNLALITGLNERNFDATFQIFPNPAKDAFKVKLSNTNNENGVIEIYNSVGQVTKTISLGNSSSIEENVSLQGLSSGIYIVKTSIGSRVSSRKLIIE